MEFCGVFGFCWKLGELEIIQNKMKKKIIIGFGALILLLAIVWIFGLFPVARINGDYMLYRAYHEHAKAFELFESKSRLASGNTALSDGEKNDIKKTVLQNLIKEQIFEQYIDKHTALAEVKNIAHAVAAGTLKDADPDVLPRATKEIFGWSVDEFVKNVIFPQALQNELEKAIENDGISFEEFTRMELSNAEVKLYAMPWKWENGGLAEK